MVPGQTTAPPCRCHTATTAAPRRQQTVRFADGSSQDISGVVWATGYRSVYSWLDIADVVQDGRVVHRRGITNITGLYFLGLPWQHTRGSALRGFVKDDAAYLADRLIPGQDPT